VSDTGLFRSGALDTKESFSFKFDKPGTYHFTCSITRPMVEPSSCSERALVQSRKLLNCSGSPTSALRRNAMASCRSSRFLPVTRTLFALDLRLHLEFGVLDQARHLPARLASIPCFKIASSLPARD